MDSLFPQATNVWVKCPGCGQETPASESTNDPELPYRCLRCRERTSAFAVATLAADAKRKELENGGKIANDNVPTSTPDSLGTRRRGTPIQRESA